ncbi:MAG: NfeD family protein [Saprospiraceae bacterium]|nr:NfeD family protein [Saprospiraceae bacterium]MDW8483940.1 NfeD family protein [Saprospiraceae bacterium]
MEFSAQFWVLVAVLALIAELLTVSFFFMFLAAGAAITALLTWMGFTTEAVSQLLCFSLVSLATMGAFRRYAVRFFGKNKRVEEYRDFVGHRATVVESIPRDGEGRVSYRGSLWIATSEDNLPIAQGTSVVIKRMDGIKVVVAPLAQEEQ